MGLIIFFILELQILFFVLEIYLEMFIFDIEEYQLIKVEFILKMFCDG